MLVLLETPLRHVVAVGATPEPRRKTKIALSNDRGHASPTRARGASARQSPDNRTR